MLRDDILGSRIAVDTIKEIAYQRLKKAIVSGHLLPGERLVETRLAEMLQISRTPLREALARLEQQGIVERLPRGGMAVANVGPEEAVALNLVRSVLEGLAAREATARLASGAVPSAALAELEQLLARMEELLGQGDLVGHLELGRQFHHHMWAMAGNEPLAATLYGLLDKIERYRYLVPKQRLQQVNEDHHAVLAAMRAGNPAAAEQAMRDHIEAAGAYYRNALSKPGPAAMQAQQALGD
jgi:DNA-binding GntR family transcriptional regulator